MQNNESMFRFVMVSDQGKAKLCNREMRSVTLDNMIVSKVVFGGGQWIGLLGFYKSSVRSDSPPQFFEIFSQKNIANCIHTIKAMKGSYITDVAV